MQSWLAAITLLIATAGIVVLTVCAMAAAIICVILFFRD